MDALWCPLIYKCVSVCCFDDIWSVSASVSCKSCDCSCVCVWHCQLGCPFLPPANLLVKDLIWHVFSFVCKSVSVCVCVVHWWVHNGSDYIHNILLVLLRARACACTHLTLCLLSWYVRYCLTPALIQSVWISVSICESWFAEFGACNCLKKANLNNINLHKRNNSGIQSSPFLLLHKYLLLKERSQLVKVCLFASV